MKLLKDNKMRLVLKIMFLISCILFAIPSIMYMIKYKTLCNFQLYFKFLLNDLPNHWQTFAYLFVLTLMTIFYFLIIKNRKKLFDSQKKYSLLIYLIMIVTIFIAVVPFTSSDVYYYLGIGRINSTYGQNPYYTTIKEFVEQGDNQKYLQSDTVLKEGYSNYWSNTTVVYGPTWTLICSSIAKLSFGNIDIAILIFKLISAIVHLLNCYFIYRLTNKKIFVILYGLNPFVLIEGIANVHNDMYVVLFILVALYFLLKKKKLVVSLMFLSFATEIKYFSILLLPFIIIYYYRKEKPGKRLAKCIEYGVIFFIMLAIPYFIYFRDIQVLNGIVAQRDRIAKGIYVILLKYFYNIPNVIENTKNILLLSFVIIYFFTCVTLLYKKEIKFRNMMQIYQKFLLVFLFFLITNFQPWYILWLFSCMMWQNSNDMKLVLILAIASQFANSIFILNSEGWENGVIFCFILIATLLYVSKNDNNRRKKIEQNCTN